ncbi:MAG TPA: universal stress protein [Thermoleophilaceae bacterium]
MTSVIVGYDGSDQARDALALGEMLCAAEDGKLVLADVYPFDPRPLTPGYETERAAARREAEATLRAAPLRRFRDANVERVAHACGSPARGLYEIAAARQPAVLVLGSPRRGARGRPGPGSVTPKLLHGAVCPVAVAPRGYAQRAGELRTLAAAFDGTDASALAVREAARIAQEAGAALRVIAIVDTFGALYLGIERKTVLDLVQQELTERAERLCGSLPAELSWDLRVMRGPVPRTLLGEAKVDVDLLVLGSRAYGPVGALLLGSVSAQVLQSSTCPVLVVPRGAPVPRDAGELAAVRAGA